MKTTRNHLRRLSHEELLDLCDAIDNELLRRQERQVPRGFVHSTCTYDPSRRRRLSSRPERLAA